MSYIISKSVNSAVRQPILIIYLTFLKFNYFFTFIDFTLLKILSNNHYIKELLTMVYILNTKSPKHIKCIFLYVFVNFCKFYRTVHEPIVKNHDQLVFVVPQLESILKSKDDVEFKMTDLMKFIK